MQEVAFRQDADEAAVIEDDDRADSGRRHPLRGLAEGVLG